MPQNKKLTKKGKMTEVWQKVCPVHGKKIVTLTLTPRFLHTQARFQPDRNGNWNATSTRSTFIHRRDKSDPVNKRSKDQKARNACLSTFPWSNKVFSIFFNKVGCFSKKKLFRRGLSFRLLHVRFLHERLQRCEQPNVSCWPTKLLLKPSTGSPLSPELLRMEENNF